MKPLVVCAVSGAKVTESAEDLERFLLRFEKGRCVRPDTAQRVGPLGAGWALGMQPEGGWVEKDALALDLLDYRPFGEHVLERLVTGKSSAVEVETAQLGERVILVADRGPNAVLGAEVPHEDRDDQGVGLVARHLDETCSAQIPALFIFQVPEELHLEKAARL